MGEVDIQQTFNPVSVDGFEQIYQPDAAQAQGTPEQAQTDPIGEAQGAPEHQISFDPNDGIALEEAAKLLGLHIDTVRKRLQKGKLKGFKVADKYGDKWLVHKDEFAKAQDDPAPALAEAQAGPEQAQADPIIEASVVDEEFQADPIQDSTASTPQIQSTIAEQERLLGIIESQAHQLKAAGDVIMYLRSELDDTKSQLKLLTDSQSKTRWWARFTKWFMGS